MNDELKKYYENYDYNSRRPMSIPLEDLRKDQADRLMKDEVFCILPWIHMHGWPTGEAYPCCIFIQEIFITGFGSVFINSSSSIIASLDISWS